MTQNGLRRGAFRLTLVAAMFAAAVTGVLVVPAVPAFATCHFAGPDAYVANLGSNTISVVDNCAHVMATIPVGNFPIAVAVSPGGAKVYVANNSDGTLSVIDAATNKVTSTIALGAFADPVDIAVSRDGSTAYVAAPGSNAVDAVDTASNMLRATVGTGADYPVAVAVSPDGSTVYAAANPFNAGVSTLYVIDAGTDMVTRTFGVGPVTDALAVSPDGSTIYAASQQNGTIDVIDAATGAVTGVIDAGGYPLQDVAVSPDGGTLYAAEESTRVVAFIDAASGTQAMASAPLTGLGGLDVTSDGVFVYAATGNVLAKINTNSAEVTNLIPVGTDPVDVATVPSPPAKRKGRWLHGVSCVSGSFCVAVGAREVAAGAGGLGLAWTGGRWTTEPIDLPGTTDDLVYQVACRSRTACMAVGGADSRPPAGGPVTAVPLAAAWNGTGWAASQPPVPVGAQGSVLRDVSCGRRSCLAVGSYRNDGGRAMPLSELWSGGSWHLLPTPDAPGGITGRFTSVSCRGAVCVATGGFQGARSGWRPLAESWNGSRWQVLAMPVPRGQFPVVQGVSCGGPGACLAVGDAVSSGRAVPFAERLAAGRWRLLAPARGGPRNAQLDSVSCPAVNRCLATGGFIRAGKQAPLAEEWNGTTWRVLRTPGPVSATLSVLDHLSCTSPRSCLAVGNYGIHTLAERWDGTRWQTLKTPGK